MIYRMLQKYSQYRNSTFVLKRPKKIFRKIYYFGHETPIFGKRGLNHT